MANPLYTQDKIFQQDAIRCPGQKLIPFASLRLKVICVYGLAKAGLDLMVLLAAYPATLEESDETNND